VAIFLDNIISAWSGECRDFYLAERPGKLQQ